MSEDRQHDHGALDELAEVVSVEKDEPTRELLGGDS